MKLSTNSLYFLPSLALFIHHSPPPCLFMFTAHSHTRTHSLPFIIRGPIAKLVFNINKQQEMSTPVPKSSLHYFLFYDWSSALVVCFWPVTDCPAYSTRFLFFFYLKILQKYMHMSAVLLYPLFALVGVLLNPCQWCNGFVWGSRGEARSVKPDKYKL